nr:hypothetical protein [uncultured Lacibacter sp.]
MKYILSLLLLTHGLIHLMGFANAFALGNVPAITKQISKPTGVIWLLTTILFLAALVFYLLHKNYWNIIALAAVLLSQTLIFVYWTDAKMGTIANVMILFIIISTSFGMKLPV